MNGKISNIPDDIIRLSEELNNYQYGYLVNGKIETDMESFFDNYKSLTIKDFEKYKVGVCWDYVHYEANWFKAHGYKYETFYVQVQDEDGDCPSHTFLVFYLPGSNKPYYFEASWKKYRGIENFNTLSELHKTIRQRHIDDAQSKCYTETYLIQKYDAASKSYEGISCKDYMMKASKGKVKFENCLLAEACKDVETARMFVRDVAKLAKKYNANYFIVTDGASGTSNNGNPAVKNARDAQIKWEKEHGFDPDEDWANESVEIEEKMLIDSEDIYYNKDKFDSGEINLCFIVGHSGSGKSTMARGITDGDKIEYYELDDVVLNKISFTMENLKEYGDLIYSFFKGPGKKYYYTEEDRKTGKIKGIDGYYEEKLIKDFVRYAISYCKTHKSKKYLIEGIWILDFIEPSLLKDYAVYIKGTSFIKSTFRAANREECQCWRNRLKLWFDRATNLKIFVNLEKELKMYRDYFTSQDINEYVFPYQYPYEFVSESNASYTSPLTRLLVPELEPIQGRIQIRKSSIEESSNNTYFISTTNMNSKTLKPKVPVNFFTKNGYEDSKTKRVCFAPSIDQCLMGMSYNCTGKEFYVHIPDSDVSFTTPSQKDVPDSKITGEIWATDEVKLRCVGKIKVLKDKGTPGKKFTYGNNKTAELYEWDWKWITKGAINEVSEEYGLPDLKKYPMPDEKHVISAIRFFNYVDKENEAELAKNIKKKMRKYNIPYSKVGEKNRLNKYLKEDTDIVSEWCFDNFDTKPVLVFDLGSVLVEQKQSFTEALMKSKLIPNELAQNIYDHIINTFMDNSKYLDYCSSTDYYKFMTDKASSDIKKYIPAALRVNLDNMGKLPYTDSLIKQLKDKGYTLLYLSNWSKWSRDEYLHNTFDFLKYFDGGIFSCDVKLMKPDHKIYEALLKKFNIEGKQCIFFDDKYENIKASIECGMYGVMFNKVTTPDWIRENLL